MNGWKIIDGIVRKSILMTILLLCRQRLNIRIRGYEELGVKNLPLPIMAISRFNYVR